MERSPFLSNVEDTTSESSWSNDDHVVDMTAAEQTPRAALRCDPCTGIFFWNLIEVILTLVQIVGAIVVLDQTKDDQNQEDLYPMIIAYICGSVFTLPILFWRRCDYSQSFSSEDGINKVMGILEKWLNYFFVGWVLMFLWGVLADPSCLDDITQHFWLWVALVAFSSFRYVVPNLVRAEKWFKYPVTYFAEKLWDFIDSLLRTVVAIVCCCPSRPE